MKCKPVFDLKIKAQSPPSRGAWIEIPKWDIPGTDYLRSPPSRGAWIEILLKRQKPVS